MEPADIDWSKIESKFIRDELYEHINAPKWLDLSAPDDSVIIADDESWFCRPDCKHPRTHHDFLNKLASPPPPPPPKMPLGERKPNITTSQSLKRRGAIASLLLSSAPSSPSRTTTNNSKRNGKKLRDQDLENQDPNLLIAENNKNNSNKVVKEAIKSSAEKRAQSNEQEEADFDQMRSKKQPAAPKLRSTLSARNLFSGKDILGQISEFYNEIKKMAAGKESRGSLRNSTPKDVDKEMAVKEEERKLLVNTNTKDDENLSVLKEVRACPPTPQRIPSPFPSGRRPRNAKAATSTSGHRSAAVEKGGILQEVDQSSRKGKRALAAKDETGNSVSDATTGLAESSEGNNGSTLDMFWLFKPCTFLGK